MGKYITVYYGTTVQYDSVYSTRHIICIGNKYRISGEKNGFSLLKRDKVKYELSSRELIRLQRGQKSIFKNIVVIAK